MKLMKLPTDSIDEDPNQPREHFDEQEIDSLAESQDEYGMLQPIVVFQNGDRFKLVDGSRRLRSRKRASQQTINAMVLDAPPDPTKLRLMQLIANSLRADLKPMEKAVAYARLCRENGWSNTELAKRLHVSKASVTQVLSYSKLPEDLQKKLNAGELAGSTAYSIARAVDRESQKALIEKARAGELKRDEANSEVRSASHSPKPRQRVQLLLATADLVVSAVNPIDYERLSALGRELLRVCRKAAAEGLDLKTLESVLADKRRTAADGEKTNLKLTETPT